MRDLKQKDSTGPGNFSNLFGDKYASRISPILQVHAGNHRPGTTPRQFKFELMLIDTTLTGGCFRFTSEHGLSRYSEHATNFSRVANCAIRAMFILPSDSSPGKGKSKPIIAF
jgi:hypothetical protein